MKNRQLLKQLYAILGKDYTVTGSIEFTKKIGDYDIKLCLDTLKGEMLITETKSQTAMKFTPESSITYHIKGMKQLEEIEEKIKDTYIKSYL